MFGGVEKINSIDRRSFIKYLASIGIFAFTGKLFGSNSVEMLEKIDQVIGHEGSFIQPFFPYPPPVEGADFAMAIDIGACIGCRRCLHACKLENNIPDEPDDMQWINLYEMQDTKSVSDVEMLPPPGSNELYTKSPKEGFWYLSFNCFHCEDPPCTKVCPTEATYKDKDGLVLVDYDRCIGCRACMGACPYSARHFNWFQPELPPERISPIDGTIIPINPKVQRRYKGVVEKCTFCVHRIRAGNPVPRCVEVCPTRARHFGDLNDPSTEVYKIVHDLRTIRIRQDLNTGPHLFYFTRGKKWLKDGKMV
jgi:Fe-S-cluster-containing dehydrogenase component